VKTQINANEQITQVAELEFFVGKNHKSEEQKYQGVFEKPVRRISVADVRVNPTNEEKSDEYFEPSIVF